MKFGLRAEYMAATAASSPNFDHEGYKRTYRGYWLVFVLHTFCPHEARRVWLAARLEERLGHISVRSTTYFDSFPDLEGHR